MNSTLQTLVEQRLALQSTQRQLRFTFNISKPSWDFFVSPDFKQSHYRSWTLPKREQFLTLLAGTRNKQQLKGLFE